MEYGFSILMFCFSALLLIYAGLIYKGNTGLIRRLWAAKIKDKKAYARRFAKILALTALAPLFSSIVALLVDIEQSPLFVVMTLILGVIAAIWFGVRFTKEV